MPTRESLFGAGLSLKAALSLVGVVAVTGLVPEASQAQTVRVKAQSCREDLSQPITQEMRRARSIFQALTGSAIPYCDERIKRMEILLKTNQPRKAARVAIEDPLFYDIKVRDMAMKWCHLNESVRNEINDCVAMVVGSMRDGFDIREMLSGNYHYHVDTVKLVSAGINGYSGYGPTVADSVSNNNHFSGISEMGLSMFHVLRRQNYQLIAEATSFNNQGVPNQTRLVVNRDPGGLLTSRGFLTAHAVAGTNRRLVEYSFKQFMCTPIQELADNTLSDQYVGPDVERAPAGDPSKYLVSCKSCHAPMDSMRPAFAFVDTNGNGTVPVFTPGVVRANKVQRPGVGYIPASSGFNNLAVTGTNATKFGWRGPTSGTGLKDFSKMLAESRMFTTCMVKNAYKTVCGADPRPQDKELIDTLASDLEARDVRDLRVVFERLALRPECVGQ